MLRAGQRNEKGRLDIGPALSLSLNPLFRLQFAPMN
jgi:hypothetical protein